MGGDGGETLVSLGEGVDASSQINRHETEPGQHTDAAVLELGLPEVVHGDPVAETQGVEADVPGVALQVLGVGEEGEGAALLGIERGGRQAGGGPRCRLGRVGE